MKKVKDFMSSPVYVIERNEPIQRARNLMFKYGIGRLPVMDGGNLIGIVTKYDITNRLIQAAPEWRRRPIDRIPINVIMTENPIMIFSDATMPQAAQLMVENGISGLPVEREREIIGMITSRDFIKFFSEQQDVNASVGDLMSKDIITVHRHHTISHILDEMNLQAVGHVLVYEDNNTPVGIITRSGLTFSKMMGPKDEMELKMIKMTRKESTAGRKQYRYIRQLPLVAEDIMTSPIRTINSEMKAVEVSKILAENQIMGMPVLENDDLVGYFSANEIVAEVSRW
ncbi:MAG: CBS domain-containing protein [Methanotrichaceae archaeon]|nr:CBS domain-containing protein [Methanotrichaceae archaeon]